MRPLTDVGLNASESIVFVLNVNTNAQVQTLKLIQPSPALNIWHNLVLIYVSISDINMSMSMHHYRLTSKSHWDAPSAPLSLTSLALL